MLVLEFTVEPFVEGRPGPHVTAAIDAARALGADVEVGPFGTSCRTPEGTTGDLAKAVIDAAFAHGATYVSLHIERAS